MGLKHSGLLAKNIVGVVAIAASVGAFAGKGNDELTVKTKSGWIEGQYKNGTEGAAREFLGIPYAKPPVGALRFASPQSAEKWKGTLEAKAHGASCMQPAGALSAPGPLSEDCLTLNVYTPSGAKNSKLPVMVFLHGGAYVSGGSNQYDGWRLAEQYGAVVVTANYRLGALGFLSLPALDTTLPAGDSGNAGLEDQRLALEWVQDNIKHFGGDNKNVTLFGESAGSTSTCLHMVSPGSQNLADQFIMQSGVCVGGMPINSKAQSSAIGSALAGTFCGTAADQLACLRAVPADSLVAWGANASIFGAGWSPTIVPGSDMLPDAPMNLIMSGQYNHGPVIVGSNKYEWGLFQSIGAAVSVSSVAEFNAEIDASYPPQIAPFIKTLYAPLIDPLANLKLIEVVTDQVFRCPARRLARAVSAGGSDVWLYSFDEGMAAHAFELPYVFGNPNPVLAPVLNEPTRETMQSFWSGFAANGNPNQPGQPLWFGYDFATDMHMSIKESSSTGFGLSKSTCDFWDTIAAAQAAAQ